MHGNLLLRGSKLVIPHKSRERVLSILHETHQGIFRSKALLRETLWCINTMGINNGVERLISNCGICQRLLNPVKPPPIQTTELPNSAWEKVEIDITGPFQGGQYCLVLVDFYSRYPEVEFLQSITSTTIINRLIKIFSVHRFTEELISDNGRQFVSEEMENFLAENGIKHRKVIPYWARANGLTEVFNKSLKRQFKQLAL